MNKYLHPVWFWLAATNAVYLLMLFYTLPELSRFSDGLTLPDMLAGGYGSEYPQTYADRLGVEGRRFFLCRQMAADMVYPALFGYTYSRLTGLLSAGAGLPAILLKRLPLLPVVAAVSDYLENFCMITVVSAHPETPQIAAAAAPFFTVAKSAAGMLTFTVLAVLLVRRLAGRIRKP